MVTADADFFDVNLDYLSHPRFITATFTTEPDGLCSTPNHRWLFLTGIVAILSATETAALLV